LLLLQLQLRVVLLVMLHHHHLLLLLLLVHELQLRLLCCCSDGLLRRHTRPVLVNDGSGFPQAKQRLHCGKMRGGQNDG
jgi:hypothetical protein